ncbi:armadillo-type protein [Syncephalis pseudoplumigaleata]|uniref:Armadillo-type protein n=1 Tax=Syncephalis pseudoplumigaleata TaxID=1712513 RepID=A0A4P9Z3W5_9FUNG|nr:armadillo-type protein [Syncephalis pseudoplumigaleata]|eukprot:RKP26230.1 armadillo-type protein [Syncephalis pseudoplumigaleata]
MDPVRRRERERQLVQQYNEAEPPRAPAVPMDSTEERIKLAFTTRTGGAYIPPARLRAMQEQITDKNSKEYQRLNWEQLKKSINGLVNKVNTANIKAITPELFKTNLIRGRGLFARSIMKAQAAALPFTSVYAALIAVLNTRMPQIGELVLSRLIVQFRRAYKRNDKPICLSSTTFIAHLCNQQVAHEIVVLQMLSLLLERPTDDSVEIAVGLIRECGAFLEEASPRATMAVFERFRGILHEAQIDKRTQYMIEVLFQVRREKYKDNPAVPEELDIVEEEEQITHTLSLDDELDVQEGLGVFKFDPEFQENEDKYAQIRAEILGEGSSGSEESGSGEESGSDEEDEDEADAEGATQALENQLKIHDRTETNLLNLRRTIYLTIMSSVDFEECAHKLMKIQLQEGEEFELCSMIMECCSQERTYFKFYGLLAERFCKINRVWADATARLFVETFETIHRFETNRLRNIAKLFAHVLSTDGVTWQVMSCIKLTEEDTTSSSRIFIKILFQEMCEALGLKQLNDRLKDPVQAEAFNGLFPVDNPKNTRFAINYFTSVGLGGLTEELREHLKNAPKLIMAQQRLMEDTSSDSSDSDSSSSSSSSDSDSSSSESDSSSSGSSSDDDDRRASSRRDRRRDRDRSSSPARAARSRRSDERSRHRSRSTSRHRRPDDHGRSARSRRDERSRSPPRRDRSSSYYARRRRSRS